MMMSTIHAVTFLVSCLSILMLGYGVTRIWLRVTLWLWSRRQGRPS